MTSELNKQGLHAYGSVNPPALASYLTSKLRTIKTEDEAPDHVIMMAGVNNRHNPYDLNHLIGRINNQLANSAVQKHFTFCHPPTVNQMSVRSLTEIPCESVLK